MSTRLTNLEGEKYGRLLVVERTDRRNDQGLPIYRCKCDCGKDVFLSSTALNHKKGTRSCGCSRLPYKYHLSYGESSLRHKYTQYKSGAKKRGLEFELSLDDLYNITQQECFYCGIPANQINKGGKRAYGEYVYNGIDRIDNEKGYTLDNCVPCCKICNYAKRNMTKDEFLGWVLSVYNHVIKDKT